ncbi:probable disease resistance protein At5g63020 [Vitis riparia]|uniref:probable disease resistance protein At5g63020 n=1 Tax=Vitis riparia TaxID=96939 RepID=UPI00155A6FCC|nr:probable disease resistance protein At5g63020 [Vitis riparia]
MDCVSPILDVVTRVWDCTAKHAVYIRDLQENMDSLRNAMQELKNAYQDVKGRVELEEQRQMRRTNEVGGWLDSVLAMELEVNEILEKGDQEIQKKCPGTCCPRNCRSSYKLGKKASKKLGAVTELRNQGRFGVVADRLPQAPVDERPMEKTVGLDLMFTEVCRCIQDEELGIIGLYGMGGAGKTTLMTKVNNEFIRASKIFEIAIWVVVSRPARVEKVQEVIRNKLDIPEDRWRNRTEDEKAVAIFNVLKAQRFVMLLDDVWERLHLQKVGVPSPNSQNKSKVILTTRSLDVCRDMEAQKSIKVECLTEEEAINLFKEKVGETTLNSHPDIPQLAETAAKECKGLPLALITIGRAMIGKSTPQEWERAILMLQTYLSKFSGMGDHVFPVLKFSYDNLPNDTIKTCFLYLAIFPEDHVISDQDLIFLWIGEGFLDEFVSIDDALNQGHHIIEHLKTVCLFEKGQFGGVKMHDVIRDMALWLDSEYRGNKNIILAEEVDTMEVHQVSKWKEAHRLHLSSTSSLEELTIPLSFPNLLTLIVGHLETLPSGFFHFMPVIKVLDLSNARITKLPTGIGKLVSLQYLNLSNTDLRELSAELATLKRLRYLLLESSLQIIFKEVISHLSMLRLFSFRIPYSFSEEEANYSRKDDKAIYLRKDNKALLEELEGLEHINWVSLPIVDALSFQKLLNSQKLLNAMRDLDLWNLEGISRLQLPRIKHLRSLNIYRCGELQDIKVNLENERGRREFVAGYIPNSIFYNLLSVNVRQLPKLLDLTWLIYIPSLERLIVQRCESMEEVIGDASGVPENLGIFSRLKILYLSFVPNLRSISRRALPFPSLETLIMRKCPNLRKLPLDSNSARNSLKTINGESEWWQGLQWEDETIQLTFTPYFHN